MEEDPPESPPLSQSSSSLSFFCFPQKKKNHPIGEEEEKEEAPQRRQIMRLRIRVSGEVVAEEEAGNGTICAICGRSFKSKNSLYGHMRSHPERKWRGIAPSPVEEEISSSSSSLPLKWSKTRKRGSRDLTPSFDGIDKFMAEAVVNLLLIANDRHYSCEIDDFGRSIGVDFSVEPELDNGGERRKKKREVAEMETLKRVAKFGCSICGKSFRTYQALGGHVAGHKERQNSGGGGEAAAAEHRCDKCGAVFFTGQALGGHKRKHWNGHESSASVKCPDREKTAGEGREVHLSTSCSYVGGGEAAAPPPRVLGFDLNEEPVEEGKIEG